MGWISSVVTKAARYGMLLFVTAALAITAASAHADVGTGDNLYRTISNNFLTLFVGSGKNVGGVFEVDTNAGNPTDPGGILLFGGVALTGNAIEAQNATPILVGTRLFVRVDGGVNGGGGGYDYIFGRNANGAASDGQWIIAPRVVGSHIEASWQTLPQTVNAVVIDPRIEIDLVASFVHDQVRFQFSIKNNSPGQSHRVGLAFTEDVDTTFITTGQPNFTLGGPLRLPNAPYLHHEAILAGGQVPPLWDVFVLGPAMANSTVPRIRSIRGILAPQNSGQTEPTRPSRFAYGDLFKLNGAEPNPPATVTTGRDYDEIWNFVPDPKIILEGAGGNDAAVTCYWDEQAVGAGQTIPIITYIGQSTADTDFSPPVSLSVSAPLALGFATLKDANGNSTGVAAVPSPFVINAYVQNLTDLLPSGGITVSPVTLFLDLPKGLALAPGETNPKTVLNVAPGQESGVSWQVVTDTTNPVNGSLLYTVTASPNIGNGKSVQRSVQVPAPTSITNMLKGDDTTQGLFTMLSFPLIFGNATPSSILHLNGDQPAPQFDLVRYNPVSGHYEPVNTFVPGLSYWFRLRLTQAQLDQLVQQKKTSDPQNVPGFIDSTQFPPLDNQVQPNSTGYKINYPRGWNQIADPNIYGIRFSEIQVFDQATLNIVDVSTATDSLHQWIQPAVFFYDTSDTNPQNWHYVLEDNLGFVMQPYQGYWILIKRDGLQFIYPGVDTPGASVTRAALVGVGLGSARTAANNWRVSIHARGQVSSDNTTTIGVASSATDNADYYKVNKPPSQENQLSLDIIHTDWTDGGRYAMDLRSPSQNRKTWNMTLTSSKPNEPVTLTWPDVAANVPRSYRLTMIDTDTNQHYDLRHSSSIVVTTNAAKTRNVQFVAEPARGSGPTLITNFDVVQNGTRAAGAPSSVSINYALSQSADTRIYIRTTSGRALRTLTGSTRASGDGSSSTGSAVWDMRDSKGAGIPSGVYNVELVAEGADGQVSRQVRPLLLTR